MKHDKILSDKLISIAMGEMYSEQALYDALQHPVVTHNDKLVIRRYMYGTQARMDHARLQEIAMNINEAKE